MKIRERKFIIGRGRDCDIVLSDDSVSRRHAELVFMQGGKLFLVDCKSQNGTLLIQNGKAMAIRQEFVSPLDTLQFGDVKISVKELLEAIRLKFPSFNTGPVVSPPKEGPSRQRARGEKLVRCGCGAVKPKGMKCQECGQ